MKLYTFREVLAKFPKEEQDEILQEARRMHEERIRQEQASRVNSKSRKSVAVKETRISASRLVNKLSAQVS